MVNSAGEPIRKTCRRFDDVGHAHALTFSCFERQPFLTSERACGWMIESIRRARSQHDFDLWAYVIMPEHVHLLIFPTHAEYSISAILKSLKLSVSAVAIPFIKENHADFIKRMTHPAPDGSTSIRFWQRGGGYDRNLWSPRYIWQTIDYIHANPVRRGLCASPMDYRWSSSVSYEDRSQGELSIDADSLPTDPRSKLKDTTQRRSSCSN